MVSLTLPAFIFSFFLITDFLPLTVFCLAFPLRATTQLGKPFRCVFPPKKKMQLTFEISSVQNILG